LRDYTEEGLCDPAVLAMADWVSYRADPDAALPRGGNSTVSRPTVEMRLKDGRVLSRQVERVPGDPSRSVSREALAAKFRDCMSFAAVLIRELETIGDVAEIMRLLTPEPTE